MDLAPAGRRRLVFVSHSGADTWVAKQIAREVGARGAVVFLDEAHVDAGADFEEGIVSFLERADELVVLLTPWALERPYVWAEIGAAWVRRIPIVGLLLGLTAAEVQTRPGLPVLLKKRDLLQLNEIETYLQQLAEPCPPAARVSACKSSRCSFHIRPEMRTGRDRSLRR